MAAGVPSPWVEASLRHLRPPPAAVLDLACGRGRHALVLLAMGYEVTAVDCDQEALNTLQGRVASPSHERLSISLVNLEERWPPECLQKKRFAAVLVVNYLHRPLLQELVGLLEPGGVLIYEAWAEGNEAFATPRNAETLAHRTLRPNELLQVALPKCEVINFWHGRLEEYEGRRSCLKQMLCARLASQPLPPEASSASLASLLAGELGGNMFVGAPEFGNHWLHCHGAAPSLPFGVPDFLQLLIEYIPAAMHHDYLAKMRHCATEGVVLADDTDTGPTEPSVAPEVAPAGMRLWSASMVKRVPVGDGEALQTESVNDDVSVRGFLEKAVLTSAEDLDVRGEGWTFVGNQLQKATPCLENLQQQLFCGTGLSGGINGYLTPSGAIGKPPHIDDHDVLVLQQAGAKTWSLLDSSTKETMAEVCLREGDALYLPQGLPHHAKAQDGEASLHLALGMHRGPMTWAATLAALLTLRGMGCETSQNRLSTAFVQEMDGRSAAFAACGDRCHWLNQLLPVVLHVPLIRALDPEDLPNSWQGDIGADLAREVAFAARRLAELLRGGPEAIRGETVGASRQRALLQAAAGADATELEAVACTPLETLRAPAAHAFWSCRERVMDQHYGNYGPQLPAPGTAELLSSCEEAERQWQRVPGRVAALLRPGGTLRVNGYRLPGLSVEELAAARFALRVYTGAAGRPFSVADMPAPEATARSVLRKLVRVGAVEHA